MRQIDTQTPHPSGICIIGRNEGKRLIACLKALSTQARPVVYVDSGSTDGSCDVARATCEAVASLDPSQPFSAARGRNKGAQLLRSVDPQLKYIQFVDADCIVNPEWLHAAEHALEANLECAAVFGHLAELHPNASIYNRLCALEWSSPAGMVKNFGSLGGIMMVRLTVFADLGGFRPEIIAGEDSEFGVRIGLAGFSVRKLDVPMATHDAEMHHFSQWWRRAVRAGHAIGHRAHLHARGPMRDCARERRSTALWGLLLPLLVLGALWPTRGFSALLLGGYGALALRIYRHRRQRGDGSADAWLYTRYNLLAKFANGWGLLKFLVNRMRGQFRIIEYK